MGTDNCELSTKFLSLFKLSVFISFRTHLFSDLDQFIGMIVDSASAVIRVRGDKGIISINQAPPMNILIATDSHKDFASSLQVGDWIRRGLREASTNLNAEVLPIGDGGEGTIEAILSVKGGEIRLCEVHDPLFRPRLAKIGILRDVEKTAVIEIAEASGSAILAPHERNTMVATSYGTGEMIRCALRWNCRRIIVGLGGSIVSDGGMGMAQALGARYYDADGRELRPAKSKGFNVLSLHKIARIDVTDVAPELRSVDVPIAADVRTKLLGSQGQAKTFGPQKGATPEEINFIEQGLSNWARVLEKTFGMNFDIEHAGAAGGLGSGLAAFLGGRLELGIDLVLREIGFEKKLRTADLVITGEGRLDETSLHGKASIVIAEKACRMGKTTIGLFGVISGDPDHYSGIFNKMFNACEASTDFSISSLEACKVAMIATGKRVGEWIIGQNRK